MAKEKITGALQDNVLTALCFSDKHAVLLTEMVEVELFESSIYQRIAEVAIGYIRRYKKPPKTHLPDLLEKDIDRANKSERRVMTDVLEDLYFIYKEGFNEEYIMEQVREFYRTQAMKIGLTEGARLLSKGDVERAKETVYEYFKKEQVAFDPGLTLQEKDVTTALQSLEHNAVMSTGITAMDTLRIGPARGELFLFLAPTNRGKTWGLIQLGKAALRHGLKVLHVTLEMGQSKISLRYMQSMFSMLKWNDFRNENEVVYKKILADSYGVYKGIEENDAKRLALASEEGQAFIKKKLYKQKLATRYKLVVKDFPTGVLTTSGLNVYLDMLERHLNYIPDLLIVDYADLMQLDSTILRVDTGRVYKDLRMIAGERNIAVASASQANRMAEDVRIVTLKHIAEDYSKAQTADSVVTYCQTALERPMGLARFFIAKAREEEAAGTVVVSQAYKMGQFHLSSAIMSDEYWNTVDDIKTEEGKGRFKRDNSKARRRKVLKSKTGQPRLAKGPRKKRATKRS